MTPNAHMPSVPVFWQKSWNAFVKFFKGDEACACTAEGKYTPKAESSKPADRKATG